MFAKVLTILMVLIANILQPSNEPAVGEAIYIALGDSIPAGIGSSLPRERSFPAVLGNLLSTHLDQPVRTINLAVPGESIRSFLSDGQLDEFRRVLDEAHKNGISVEAVTLTLGGNDLLDLRNEDAEQREAALATFRATFPEAIRAVSGIDGNDATIYVSTLYDPTGEDPASHFSDAWWIEQFNAVIRDAVTAEDVHLIDLAVALGADAQELTRYPADIHPTNDGHVRIAQVFWSEMGIDRESPNLELVSSVVVNRFTPTLQFEVGPDAELGTFSIQTEKEGVTIYSPVVVGRSHIAVLINASRLQSDALEVTVQVADAAGNLSERRVEILFNVSR